MTGVLAPEELEGKTRAELLELCKARGMKATGWKRDRMFAELTGEKAPVKQQAPDKKAVAEAIANKLEGTKETEPEPAEVGGRGRRGKQLSPAKDRLAARTGRCIAILCKCESWIPGEMDANRIWTMCADCGHTQWVHSAPEVSAAGEEGGDEGEAEPEGEEAPGGDADENENDPESGEEGDEEGEEDTEVE